MEGITTVTIAIQLVVRTAKNLIQFPKFATVIIIISYKDIVCKFVSHLALDQKCRHALYQCIKCLLAGTFIRVTEFNYQKNNNKSIHDCSLCSVIVITVLMVQFCR